MSKSCQNSQIISSHPLHFAENPSKLRHFMTSCHVPSGFLALPLGVYSTPMASSSHGSHLNFLGVTDLAPVCWKKQISK